MPNELGGLPFENGADLRLILSALRLFGNFTQFVVRSQLTRAREVRVFVVHGREDSSREGVARFLEQQGLQVVILQESVSAGQTILEKLEAHGNVGFAVIVMTPDDRGYLAEQPDRVSGRARQNVVLEAGYFLGRLGRQRVCLLHRGDLELPSDLGGVVYIVLDPFGGWKPKLASELVSAGLRVRPRSGPDTR